MPTSSFRKRLTVSGLFLSVLLLSGESEASLRQGEPVATGPTLVFADIPSATGDVQLVNLLLSGPGPVDIDFPLAASAGMQAIDLLITLSNFGAESWESLRFEVGHQESGAFQPSPRPARFLPIAEGGSASNLDFAVVSQIESETALVSFSEPFEELGFGTSTTSSLSLVITQDDPPFSSFTLRVSPLVPEPATASLAALSALLFKRRSTAKEPKRCTGRIA